jgi:hypothetical protein
MANLHLATDRLNYAQCKELLENGHNVDGLGVNARDNVGTMRIETPLHIAVRAGSHRIAELFMGHGASLGVLDGGNRTPLSLALYDMRMLRILLASPAFTLRAPVVPFPSDFAVTVGNREALRVLACAGGSTTGPTRRTTLSVNIPGEYAAAGYAHRAWRVVWVLRRRLETGPDPGNVDKVGTLGVLPADVFTHMLGLLQAEWGGYRKYLTN